MKESANTLGIHFYIKKYKENNGKSPIYARITVNKRRVDFSIKRRIDTKSWQEQKGRAIDNCPENKILNTYLERIRSKIVNHYQELVLEGKHVTSKTVKDRYFGNDKMEYTLNKVVVYHNEQMKHVLALGSMKNYYTTQKYLSRFLKKKFKDDDIPLAEINYKFVVDFEMFLRNWKPTDHQRPLNNNGIMKHMQRFRKMINMARKLEWISNDPFANFKTRMDKVERGYLCQEELTRIEEKELNMERMELVRDLFVFSCYTGFSYIDVVHLSNDNLTLGIDGNHWIHTKRQKSDIPVKIPLLPKALEIVNKYADDPRATHRGTLLPAMSNQKLNAYLKELGDLCKVKKNMSFHLARHTFATTVTLTNGVPIETVSKMLGHTKLSTTQIYAKVIERKLSHDMQLLKNKLESRSIEVKIKNIQQNQLERL